MAISLRNNRALNRVLRSTLRAQPRPETTTPQNNAPAYTLCADIPENYNDSYVKAIPQDPQNTFVYWELPKEQTAGSPFAHKGTAHVEHNEAVRIGEQLNNHRRENNDRPQNHYRDHYRQTDQRDDNRYSPDNSRHHSQTDNGRLQTFRGNANPYVFDGNNQHPRHDADNRRQISRNDGNQYNFDNGNQHHNHNDDRYRQADNGYCQINWGDGAQYRQDNIYQLNPNDGNQRYDNDSRRFSHCRQGDIYRLIRHDDGAAFSEMLSALIARCGQYIADYRLNGSRPTEYALSSGLLCNARGGKLP